MGEWSRLDIFYNFFSSLKRCFFKSEIPRLLQDDTQRSIEYT